MSDPLAQLIAAPLRPLPERWTVPDRVAQLEQARALGSADAYWEWVARQQRWSQPWTRVRSGPEAPSPAPRRPACSSATKPSQFS